MSEVYNLKWDEHYHKMVLDSFWNLLDGEVLTDCTLVSASSESLKVHRLILSANSPYFRALLKSHASHPHPIIILHDVDVEVLRMLVTFMYRGEVNVSSQHFPLLLKTAENLQIIGLSQNRDVQRVNEEQQRKETPSTVTRETTVYSKKARILDMQFNNWGRNVRHHSGHERVNCSDVAEGLGTGGEEQEEPLALRKKEGHSLSAPSTPISTSVDYYNHHGYNSSDEEKEMDLDSNASNNGPHSPTLPCPYCPTQNNSPPSSAPHSSGASVAPQLFTPSALTHHIATAHPLATQDASASKSHGNQILCKFCSKPFPEVSSLIQHLPIHTGERPFKCEFCGKAFKLRHHMKDHARVHTGERPFRCGLCGKTFSRSTILKAHEKTHFPKGQGE